MYKKYQWYIIDYGQIWHKSFPLSQLDTDLNKICGDYNYDLFRFILEQDIVFPYVRKYNFDIVSIIIY